MWNVVKLLALAAALASAAPMESGSGFGGAKIQFIGCTEPSCWHDGQKVGRQHGHGKDIDVGECRSYEQDRFLGFEYKGRWPTAPYSCDLKIFDRAYCQGNELTRVPLVDDELKQWNTRGAGGEGKSVRYECSEM